MYFIQELCVILFKKYLTAFDVVKVPVLLHVLYSRVLCYCIKKVCENVAVLLDTLLFCYFRDNITV